MKRALCMLALALGWSGPASAQAPSQAPAATPTAAPAAAPKTTAQAQPRAAARGAQAAPTAPAARAEPAAQSEPAARAEPAEGAGHEPQPAAAGHGGQTAPRQDINDIAADLPAGTIEALIMDPQERPIAGRLVRLAILKTSIAEGNDRSERFATTDERGAVRFPGLDRGSQFSYSITVDEGAAHYSSSPFNLNEEAGVRATLHVYPVTSNIEQTSVVMRGIVYIEPRDDVFQLEVMFRVANVGSVSWVPQGTTLELPPASKGFTTSEEMSTARFVKVDDRTVRLEGTFGPGQHDVRFRFQIPNDHDSSVRFELPMPPRVAELQLMVESSPGMQLEAEGFPPAEPKANQRGQRVLFTARQLAAENDQPVSRLDATLSGIPTPGAGRWGAVTIALILGVSGLFVAARRRSRNAPQTLGKEELVRAREVVLDELLGLERAKQSVDLGPQTYESIRRVLFDALLRIEQRRGPAAAKRPAVKRAPSEG